MCNSACLDFGKENLDGSEIKGKRVLEVGALNVNGSMREWVTAFGPAEYIGIDLKKGDGVDRVMSADDILKEFGEKSFDLLISTEMLEHAENWKLIISNFKRILKPGGALLITTRSEGFPFHEYPIDAWRFEVEDMREIFSDFEIKNLISDPYEPGVFIKAVRPKKFSEKDLSDFELFSVPKMGRVK